MQTVGQDKRLDFVLYHAYHVATTHG
jgi:hypothetical protein